MWLVSEIVKRSDDVSRIQLLPHRWVVDAPSHGWEGFGRMSKDYEFNTDVWKQ